MFVCHIASLTQVTVTTLDTLPPQALHDFLATVAHCIRMLHTCIIIASTFTTVIKKGKFIPRQYALGKPWRLMTASAYPWFHLAQAIRVQLY